MDINSLNRSFQINNIRITFFNYYLTVVAPNIIG